MRIALALIAAVMLAGCATLDKYNMTSFVPGKSIGGYDYFTYRATADLVYPLESANAEAQRREWLQGFLDDNGYGGRPAEVLSRKPILKQKGLLGDMYEVFYEVRVKASNR